MSLDKIVDVAITRTKCEDIDRESTNSTCNTGGEIGREGRGSNYTSEIPIHVTHRFQTYRIITSALGNMSVWYIEKYH